VTISTEVTLQPWWVGEIPEYTYLTVAASDGSVLDCTGATAVTCKYSVDGGTVGTATATASTPAAGVFRITWPAAAVAAPGTLRAVCWFTLGSFRLVAGVITVRIIAPPVPIT
jgi:hypothetical protein